MSVFPYRHGAAFMAAAIMFYFVYDARARSPEASQCMAATAQAERALHIPDGFLSAMSRVESGRPEPDGVIAAWPWTVNAAGVGYHYASRDEAIEAVRTFHQQGIVSIDVGCMQVNLQQHPNAFSSLDQAFDPLRNALYAGNFLIQMYEKTGSWPRAAAAYHSQTPGIGSAYQWKVLETWAVPQDERGAPPNAKRGTAASSPVVQAATLPNGLVLPQQRKPMLISAPTNADGEAPPRAARVFRPFTGSSHFEEPAPHRPAMSGMRGRTLASYRATPVALAGQR
ncbi:transglycosylase SLT domain-containing protein [Komagataeibacter saccharivorans]|uniref:transglycosylase SLT domain-containing protein n=1 Tax=Komagataeibacter saccharivorans TaxID=265959 RepID=UPI0039EB160A